MIFRLPISRINRPGYFAGKKRGRRKEVGREGKREEGKVGKRKERKGARRERMGSRIS